MALYFKYVHRYVIWIYENIRMEGVVLLTFIFLCISSFNSESIFIPLYVFMGILLLGYMTKKCRSKLVVRCSEYSFFIYSFHEFYEAFIKRAIMMVIPINSATLLAVYIFLPCVIIPCCVMVGIIIEIKFPRLYKLICGGR